MVLLLVMSSVDTGLHTHKKGVCLFVNDDVTCGRPTRD